MREALKKARESKRLKVPEIAEKVEISASYYYKIESGVRNPTMRLAKRLSIILDEDINTLFFE